MSVDLLDRWKSEIASGLTQLGYEAWCQSQPVAHRDVLISLHEQLGRERDARVAAERDATAVRATHVDALQRRDVEVKRHNQLIEELRSAINVQTRNWDDARLDAKQKMAAMQDALAAREYALVEATKKTVRRQLRIESIQKQNRKEVVHMKKKAKAKPVKKATKKGFVPFGKKK